MMVQSPDVVQRHIVSKRTFLLVVALPLVIFHLWSSGHLLDLRSFVIDTHISGQEDAQKDGKETTSAPSTTTTTIVEPQNGTDRGIPVVHDQKEKATQRKEPRGSSATTIERTANVTTSASSKFLPILRLQEAAEKVSVMTDSVGTVKSTAAATTTAENVTTRASNMMTPHLQEEKEEDALEIPTVMPATISLSNVTDMAAIAPSNFSVEDLSVLYYQACCGLGHRLARMAAASDAATRLGFRLQGIWGKCGPHREDIFDFLFRPETPQELAAHVHSRHETYTIKNEVITSWPMGRTCVREELQSSYKFFNSLKERFRWLDEAEQFIQQHFHNKLAFGIHIRDGNGETGDFAKKKRGLQVTPEEYTQRVVGHIIEFIEREKNVTRGLPDPVLFVATDNPKYVGLFRTEFAGRGIPVLAWQQEHGEEGTGVFLGQRQKKIGAEQCFQNWKDMVMDMILLSSADVVIAGQFSSFSQTMPMQLALGQPPDQRKVATTFCEVMKDGAVWDCYEDAMKWCRTTKGRNVLKTMHSKQAENLGWSAFLNRMSKSPHYYNRTNHKGRRRISA